jgi:hypothetical protein
VCHYILKNTTSVGETSKTFFSHEIEMAMISMKNPKTLDQNLETTPKKARKSNLYALKLLFTSGNMCTKVSMR